MAFKPDIQPISQQVLNDDIKQVNENLGTDRVEEIIKEKSELTSVEIGEVDAYLRQFSKKEREEKRPTALEAKRAEKERIIRKEMGLIEEPMQGPSMEELKQRLEDQKKLRQESRGQKDNDLKEAEDLTDQLKESMDDNPNKGKARPPKPLGKVKGPIPAPQTQVKKDQIEENIEASSENELTLQETEMVPIIEEIKTIWNSSGESGVLLELNKNARLRERCKILTDYMNLSTTRDSILRQKPHFDFIYDKMGPLYLEDILKNSEKMTFLDKGDAKLKVMGFKLFGGSKK